MTTRTESRAVIPYEDSHDARRFRRTPSLTLLGYGTRLDIFGTSDAVPRAELPALPPPPPEEGVLVLHPATASAQAPAGPPAIKALRAFPSSTEALPALPAPKPQQPILAALPAPAPTELGAPIARMAEVMKGGANIADTTGATEEHVCVVTEMKKASPSLEATAPKPKERSHTNGRRLVTPDAHARIRNTNPHRLSPRRPSPRRRSPIRRVNRLHRKARLRIWSPLT